jgi:hypothetical protein
MQGNRYDVAHRTRVAEDKRFNNDYVRACTRCLDRRQPSTEVFCPKVGHEIPNVSDLRSQDLELAEYWEPAIDR